jgi:hypothetical protein
MAKNTVFILFCFGCLLLFSCKKNIEKIEPRVYDIEIAKTINILLEEEDRDWMNMYSLPYDLVDIDKKPMLIVNNSIYKKLSFYDIESGKKVNEIFTDENKILISYKYINKDSIFCFYEGDYDNPDLINANYGQIQLIDNKGNIKRNYIYHVDNPDIANKGLDISRIIPPRAPEKILQTSGHNIFFSSESYMYNDLGTTEYINDPTPCLMYYDINKQKINLSKHSVLPYIKEGIYYPTDFDFENMCMSANNLPLVRYVYSSDVFEWDYANDKIIPYSLKSRLLDTIKPSSKPTYHYSKNLEAAYTHIFYDKNNELYFSYLYFMDDFYEKNNATNSSIIITNKDFEYLGEIYNCSFYPGELSVKDYFIDYNFTNNDSIIEVYYLKLVKTERDYNSYIDSCKKDLEIRKQKKQSIPTGYSPNKNPIVTFLKSHEKANTPEYVAVTIYTQGGCPSCSESVLSLISENKEMYEKSLFYLIIAANNARSALQTIKPYNLSDFKNLVIDSTGIIKKLTTHDDLLNPRLTHVKNDVVVLDTIYNASDIKYELLPKITIPK